MRYKNLVNHLPTIASKWVAVPEGIADFVEEIHVLRIPPGHLHGAALALVPIPGTRQWFYRTQEPARGRGPCAPDRMLVSGPQTRTMRVPFLQRQRDLVSVVYKPGVRYRLTGVPQCRFLDAREPAGELCGGGPRETLPSVEAYLTGLRERLRSPTAFDAVVVRTAAAAPDELPTVRELADECYMGLRQFERTCHLRLGFSPKVFLRLVRFSAALGMRRREPGARWLDIALRCGYFDQMHFIHDFKTFTGSVPSALASVGGAGWCLFGEPADASAATRAASREASTGAFA